MVSQKIFIQNKVNDKRNSGSDKIHRLHQSVTNPSLRKLIKAFDNSGNGDR